MLAFLRCAGVPDEIVEALRMEGQQALVRFQVWLGDVGCS